MLFQNRRYTHILSHILDKRRWFLAMESKIWYSLGWVDCSSTILSWLQQFPCHSKQCTQMLCVQSVCDVQEGRVATEIVPMLSEKTKVKSRWDSDESQWTFWGALVAQNITISDLTWDHKRACFPIFPPSLYPCLIFLHTFVKLLTPWSKSTRRSSTSDPKCFWCGQRTYRISGLLKNHCVPALRSIVTDVSKKND